MTGAVIKNFNWLSNVSVCMCVFLSANFHVPYTTLNMTQMEHSIKFPLRRGDFSLPTGFPARRSPVLRKMATYLFWHIIKADNLI